MKISYIHYYVKNLVQSREKIFKSLGFQVISQMSQKDIYTEILSNGFIYFILSEGINQNNPVSHYLQHHPSGVVDIAFEVKNLESLLKKALENQAEIVNPITNKGIIQWAKIRRWGSLNHTLIENSTSKPSVNFLFDLQHLPKIKIHDLSTQVTTIDHLVLNVNVEELNTAANWYHQVFNFQFQQSFNIHTFNSGLHSICLKPPSNNFWFNINIPSSANSQIQEFLDCNQGAGIQHIALRCRIIPTVKKMRKLGLSFLKIPASYYTKKSLYFNQIASLPLSLEEYKNLVNLEILMDWEEEEKTNGLLLQIFTQPIFETPTFFFELIERRKGIQGFGYGNFQALFEAMETEQIKRGYITRS